VRNSRYHSQSKKGNLQLGQKKSRGDINTFKKNDQLWALYIDDLNYQKPIEYIVVGRFGSKITLSAHHR
jgi:hypothetical protein